MDLQKPGNVYLSCSRAAGFLGWLAFCLLLAACTRPPPQITRSPVASPTPVRLTNLPPGRTSLPTYQPTLTPAACASQPGQIATHELSSAALPRPLQLRIYLPPCYHPDAPSPYPLLILLHGQGSQADQWERLGVTAAADHLILQGVISAPVIVMPQEDDTYSNPFESGYDRALVDDLLPWMEENYAVCASRECRAIGGISRGAAWAMYIALNRPGQFGAVGAHSFPSFYGDETRLPLLLRDIPPGQLPRIWMDTGSRDRYLSQARRYHELLDQYHVPHEWHVYEGEHDEAYWSAHLEDYLKWYLAEKLVPKT